MEGLTVALIVHADRPGFWILQVILVVFALAVLVSVVPEVLRWWQEDRPEE